MQPSLTTRTLAVLVVFTLVAAAMTWFVVERRDAREESSARAAHPLRVVSSGVASTSLIDIAGNTVSLSVYADSWTIITSWATWCPACRDQLKSVATVQERFADQGLVAIAYNRTEPMSTIDAFTTNNSLPENLVLVRDTTDALFVQFDGYTMPETIIVSPTGKIVQHYRGVVTESALQSAIATVLRE